MNNYQMTRPCPASRPADRPQARTAWWRQQRLAVDNAQAPTSPSRLHWSVPVVARGASGRRRRDAEPIERPVRRDREFAEADEALAAAASGVPQALLVGGDAGIGKTTLISHVANRAREKGFTVLTGQSTTSTKRGAAPAGPRGVTPGGPWPSG